MWLGMKQEGLADKVNASSNLTLTAPSMLSLPGHAWHYGEPGLAAAKPTLLHCVCGRIEALAAFLTPRHQKLPVYVR